MIDPHAFAPPPPGSFGFAPCAGPMTGLARVMMATGRLPAGDLHPLHRHRGDEILAILDGRVLLRLGEDRRVLIAGDVVSIPPGVWHGMRTLTEAALAVVAERGMGTAFAHRGAHGVLVGTEIHRRDVPWCPPPPDGRAFTSDADLAALKAAAAAIDPLDDGV